VRPPKRSDDEGDAPQPRLPIVDLRPIGFNSITSREQFPAPATEEIAVRAGWSWEGPARVRSPGTGPPFVFDEECAELKQHVEVELLRLPRLGEIQGHARKMCFEPGSRDGRKRQLFGIP